MHSLRKIPVEVKVAAATGVVFFSMLISRTLLSDTVDVDTRAKLFRFHFILLLNSLLLIGSLCIWKRTVTRICGPRGTSSALRKCWEAVVFLFLLMVHSSYLTMFYLVAEEPHWFALVSYTCLGAYILLLFFLFSFGCLGYCYRLVRQAPYFTKSQPQAVAAASPSAICSVLAIIATVVLSAFGLRNASLPPEVVRVEIPQNKLPHSLDSLKLVLLSDIHLGPTVGRSRLELIVSMVNELDADVVVIAGDLADSQVSRLLTVSEPLRHMKSRLGSYFVTGNHDYYTADVEQWFSHLLSFNIQPLHNSHVRVSRPERRQDWLCLAGVDDLEARFLRYPGHGMDVKAALKGCGFETPIILVAHQPRAAYGALQDRPDIGLVLSGHTHAGQIFPLSILAYLVNPFFSGLYQVGHSLVYVSPGTVYYGIPMRIGSHAQITEIILKAL